jgi:hypothetical protein
MSYKPCLKFAVSFLLVAASLNMNGQLSPIPSANEKDRIGLKDVFMLSKIEARFRTLFMTTINQGDLRDDYAWAAGLGAGITTFPYKGFQAGFSAFSVYNLLSSDFYVYAPLNVAPNRYELGLFDIEEPYRKKDLVRIENLFLRYTYSKVTLTAGRMKLNTPFLNPQDGRMNATMEEGIWVTGKKFDSISFSGGWLWNISPRSTTRWYTVSNSLGLYPSGVSETGTPSAYYHNTSTAGIALANIMYERGEKLKVSVTDMLVDNVMNSAVLELNFLQGDGLRFYQGLMFIHQDPVNNGGNADPAKAYFSRNARSNAVSGQLGVKNKKYGLSLNYTHITGDGRYLAPREWGRDPFYTFMFREKNDGFGKLHAMVVKMDVNNTRKTFRTGLAYGYFSLPDVKDYRLNKYGMPSYHQLNFDCTYVFDRQLKGLEIKLLAAWKINAGETYGNAKFVYNKVDMANITLAVDFRL